jgi:TRAF3-interacting protein 1
MQGAPVDIRAGKVIGGLEPEYTCQFLILLAQLATNPNVDSDAAVRRCLAGESAGPPAAMKSSSRAESKSDYGHENSSRQELSKSRPDDDFKGIEAKRDDFDMVAPERGKSRGGTRGGNKPGQQTASTAGLNTAPGRPSTLDADIEKCDGSYEVTTELMGNLIAKPRMSEKLLSKPPFRFLHDIVVEVIKTTGFARTLFDESELNSENVKEKEQKIAFLEKIIALVGVQLNTLLEAKAGKIVAGLNPQDTNRFLQLLALAARDMPDSTAAVRTVLGQNSDTSAMTSNPAPAPVEPPSRNAATRESRERDNLAESRPKQEEKMDKPKESSRPAKTMSAPAQVSSFLLTYNFTYIIVSYVANCRI